MASAKASWGSVRKLASGRYQARYRLDGKMVGAPTTFRTKRDAEAYLSTVRSDMERGQWVNPVAGKVTLREYSTKWLEQRPDLRPRTVELYEGELQLHILPVLGGLELAKITPTKVRDWHSALIRADKPGNSTVAKCYWLLHAILNTAVADELLMRNPCAIKGAGQEKAPERPIASIPQVFEIAETIEPRFRAMVLVGAFVGLRLGEMLALTRERVDLRHGRIKVVEQYQELKDGTRVLGPPKSEAMKALDIEGMKPHDLRHTGNTLAAMTGASTKELMARFGQSTSRAALIYQHATQDRDHEIADALNGLIEAKLKQRPNGMDGATPIA